MPKGGARPGAGRKAKPLAQKLAEGNPGKRPLKKVEFDNTSYNPANPPAYLADLEKKYINTHTLVSPLEIYQETIAYLEPSECLHLIPAALIREYVMANYHMVQAHYELSNSTLVGKDIKGNVVVTSFTEAMLKLEKNLQATWQPIWEIVSKNSERIIDNPEHDLFTMVLSGRIRRKTGGGK